MEPKLKQIDIRVIDVKFKNESSGVVQSGFVSFAKDCMHTWLCHCCEAFSSYPSRNVMFCFFTNCSRWPSHLFAMCFDRLEAVVMRQFILLCSDLFGVLLRSPLLY